MIVQGKLYEHTQPWPADAVARYTPGDLPAIIRGILKGEAFDAAEFSLAAWIILVDRGDVRMAAVPVFPARTFFHSCLWVRFDSPLHALADLRGKTVALRDYTSTTSIWFRGYLKERHGVDWKDIRWVSNPAGRFPPPPEAAVVPGSADLEDMLCDGAVDAFFSVRTKDQKKPPAERVLRRLLADPQSDEEAWFRYDRIFPILHTVVVSNAALAKDVGAARAIFDGYAGAKSEALRQRLGTTMLPWSEQLWDRAADIVGRDPLPYGLSAENRRVIERLVDYMLDQKLIARRIPVDELFVPGSYAWAE
jgi:4,5-dihydroxyphthalate decarboxylase